MTHTRHVVVIGIYLMILAQPFGSLSARAGFPGQGPIITGNPAPSAEQIQALIARAVENQHRNDRAIEEFERVERVIAHRDLNAAVVSDLTDLVIPSGTGTMKLPMAANGTPVPQDTFRQELQYAVSALDLALHPNDRYKQDMVKFERRRRDRREFVETAVKAFKFRWVGRETLLDSTGRATHSFTKFLLEPDPNFKPPTRLAVTFQHIHATLWMDESQAEFARLEGDITSDITFGGGIVGKVYHGGHFTMDQSEVAPGVWLPTLYTYDVDGRKFMFGFGVHERTEVTRYRHLGPPEQSIQIIRNELNNLTAETPSH